ncbi:hypothetical protein ACFLU3_03525 [Chloroflexota bacterium]
MTDERKDNQKNNARFEAPNCMEMMKMMNRKGTGCDCSQMMARMAKMDDADDEGWAEMMKMCCSIQQEDKEAKDQPYPI